MYTDATSREDRWNWPEVYPCLTFVDAIRDVLTCADLTRVELLFDIVGVAAATGISGRATALEAVRPGAPAARDLVPVLPALRPVVPGGGLRPGSVVGVQGPGAGSLGLALVAGVSRHGGWCAAVGLPELGVLAATGMGADPERLLLVEDPGERWGDVVAALAEAVELILIRPPERPGTAIVRRLGALARKNGCVLAVTGHAWDGAQLRLHIDRGEWAGLGDGHGHLRGRRARVTAEGRGSAGRGGRAWIWLPGPDGTVSTVEETRPSLEVVA